MQFLGDINNDGEITIEDILYVAKTIKGGYTLTEDELVRADINGDGVVSALDYVMFQRHFYGTQIINNVIY